MAEIRGSDEVPEDRGSVLASLNALLKRWRVVGGVPLIAVLVTLGVSLITPATYTATTTFVPEPRSASRLPAALQGVAGELGLSIGSEATESPRFYARVATSRELLERILLSSYQSPSEGQGAGDSTPLLHTLGVHGRDAADSLANGVRELRKLVAIKVDNLTNMVSLSVDAHDPTLAATIANRFVQYLNDFNTRTRQSQAGERRRFVEERVDDVSRALKDAEEAVKIFYERNRSWQQSPQLAFAEARLRRQVEIQQELYLTLKREYETARIEEVNDTPVITIIDTAVPPRERSKPRRKLLALVALLLGGMTGVFWASGAEYLDRLSREERQMYAEVVNRLQRVGRAIRSALGMRDKQQG